MSERLEFARRRLELTDATEQGDAIEGRLGRQRVRLVAGQDEQRLEVDLGVVPLERLCVRGEEVNDPDVATSGNAPFDNTVLVLARDGHGPQLSRLFRSAKLRETTLELFRLFPGAEAREDVLVVPHLSFEHSTVSLALGTATAFASALAEEWARIDALPAVEAPPELAEPMWWRDPKRYRDAVRRAGWLAGGGAALGALFTALVGADLVTGLKVIFGVAVAGAVIAVLSAFDPGSRRGE